MRDPVAWARVASLVDHIYSIPIVILALILNLLGKGGGKDDFFLLKGVGGLEPNFILIFGLIIIIIIIIIIIFFFF